MEKELVVSRFNEDVSWVKGWDFEVSVYNKGLPLELDDPNIDVIDVANLGREAGTWLLHICNHYDDLADWTYFVQGKPHANDLRGRCAVEYSDTTGLTTEYLPHFPTAEVKAKDKVEHVGGYEVRYGLADPVVVGRCDACESPCDDVWSRWFTGPRPDPWWFCYAAEYAVPRHRITARSRIFWISCLEAVSNTSNDDHKGITTAWAFELLWVYLFGDADKYPVRLPVQPPGLLTMAGNFISSATKQVLAGNPQASEEVQAKRKAICESCPLYDSVKRRCAACGCTNMPLKWQWETSRCPKNYW